MNKALFAVFYILPTLIHPSEASASFPSPTPVFDFHQIEELPALLETFSEGYEGMRTVVTREEEELVFGEVPVLKPLFMQAKGYLRGVSVEEIA